MRCKITILCIALGTTLLASALFTRLVVSPNLDDIASIRGEVVVSRTVNKALAALFQEESRAESLFITTRDDEGKLSMVEANYLEINLLLSNLTTNLQAEFKSMEREELEVPLGSLIGSKLLSQSRPRITIYIEPLSVSSMDFKTEFETQGINQTKYKIYIELTCRIKVIAPLSNRTINSSSKILIAETVILGEVPDSYVQVPQDDILDVT